MNDVLALLRSHSIQPTPQRLEVARCALRATDHPSADRILEAVRKRSPTVSRATVYNTLNLLVEKGLLATKTLREGAVVFDPRVDRHHHLIDADTGEIHDVPWDALEVTGIRTFAGYEVQEYHVVLRGRRKRK